MGFLMNFWYPDNSKLSAFIDLECEQKNNILTQTVRVISLIMMVICIVCFSCFPLTSIPIFVSNWPVFTVAGHVILTLKLSHQKNSKHHQHQLAAAHFLFTFTVILNLTIMPIYWSLLHELALIKFAGNTCQINQLYFVHIFPTIAMVLLWFATDIRLDSSHGLKLSPIALFYCFINFVATKVRG